VDKLSRSVLCFSIVVLALIVGCAGASKNGTGIKGDSKGKSPNSNVTIIDQNVKKCQMSFASIMIGKFDCKSPQCGEQAQPVQGLMAIAMLSGASIPVALGDLGGGMSSMVTTALKESGCFDVQDRQVMQQIEEELARVGKKVEIQQADYIISGVITDAVLSRDRKAIGGGWIPVIGSVRKEKITAKMDFDLKIIDVNNAKVVAAKTFSGNSEKSSTSVSWRGYRDISAFGGLSSIKGTPMEGVVRDVMNAAVDYATNILLTEKNIATNMSQD
jgi:curli biogenesis system outer membrane secretion channel CsgG